SAKAVATGYSKPAIQQYAAEFAEQLEFEPGDSLEELIKALGGTIKYQGVEDWDRNEHGSIVVDPEQSSFTVWLADFTGPLRDRFTLAHELGHYILHSKLGKVSLMRHRHGLDKHDRMEREADWFAAAFLMPGPAFRKAMQEDSSVRALAAQFHVSRATAQWRLDEINNGTGT
ncbi:MAG: ImmA/IrrE family metallo-endopeptidase, partial [Magnetococcales bacterium]|nr:ImmA/IrrE family metallo-endopeptidase [Magnetococcales bacterium]